MGLLDEAIREHLELKRRRGADPREVAQQEKEALGPVDREAYREEARAAAAAADAPVEDHADSPELPFEEPVAPGALEDDDLEYEVDLPEDDDLGWEEDDEPEEATRMMDAPASQAPVDEVPADIPPAPEASSPPAGVDQPTSAYSLDDLEELGEDAPRAEARDIVPADDEPADGEGDVLEETPDFLEETPEHDRLWFEQKPPRDFDF